MRPLLDIAIAIAVAVLVGLSTAWLAVDRGYMFGSVSIGDWTAWPRAGTPDADPYSLAWLARSGVLPLGAGEGIAFSAKADHDGEPLTGKCVYRVVGQTPAARLWTLTAYDREGRLMPNAAQREAFHSQEILRRVDGSFEIMVAADVQPGNWLPITRVDDFELVLRLYDTPLTTGGAFGGSTMPEILREACR